MAARLPLKLLLITLAGFVNRDQSGLIACRPELKAIRNLIVRMARTTPARATCA